MLLFAAGAVRQYKEIYFPEFCLKVSKGDNSVKIDSRLGLVQNICIQNNDVYIIYIEFESVDRFYEYSFDSCRQDFMWCQIYLKILNVLKLMTHLKM